MLHVSVSVPHVSVSMLHVSVSNVICFYFNAVFLCLNATCLFFSAVFLIFLMFRALLSAGVYGSIPQPPVPTILSLDITSPTAATEFSLGHVCHMSPVALLLPYRWNSAELLPAY